MTLSVEDLVGDALKEGWNHYQRSKDKCCFALEYKVLLCQLRCRIELGKVAVC